MERRLDRKDSGRRSEVRNRNSGMVELLIDDWLKGPECLNNLRKSA